MSDNHDLILSVFTGSATTTNLSPVIWFLTQQPRVTSFRESFSLILKVQRDAEFTFSIPKLNTSTYKNLIKKLYILLDLNGLVVKSCYTFWTEEPCNIKYLLFT